MDFEILATHFASRGFLSAQVIASGEKFRPMNFSNYLGIFSAECTFVRPFCRARLQRFTLFDRLFTRLARIRCLDEQV